MRKKSNLNTLSSRLSTHNSSLNTPPLSVSRLSTHQAPTPDPPQSSLKSIPKRKSFGRSGGYLISGYLAQSSAFAGCGAAAIGRLWTLRKRPFKRDGREAHVLTSTAAPAPVAVTWVGGAVEGCSVRLGNLGGRAGASSPLSVSRLSTHQAPTPDPPQSSLKSIPKRKSFGRSGGYLISGYLAQSSAFAGCGAAAIGRLWTLRKRPFKRDGREAHVLTSTVGDSRAAAM